MNIFISGGSSGIGLYLVENFLRQGHSIFTTCRKKQSNKFLCKKFSTYKKKFRCEQIDFSNLNSVNKLTKKISIFFKNKIDVIINNAGSYGEVSKFTETNIKNWIKSINSNLISHFIISSKLSNLIIKKKTKATIINISGGGAVRPMKYLSSYCASKSGLVRVTEVMALELKKTNVRVYAIAPGLINTNIHQRFINNKKTFKTSEAKQFKKSLLIQNNNLEKVQNTINFLIKKNPINLSGKLISVQFDNVQKISKQRLSDSFFTLRRIDEFFFSEKKINFK